MASAFIQNVASSVVPKGAVKVEITLVGEIERVKKLLVDNEKFDVVKATNKIKTWR